MHRGTHAYRAVAKEIASPRELEASLLLKAAARLQAVVDSLDRNRSDLDGALLYNRKLWTVFLGSAMSDDNPLPVEIRQNVANLGMYIMSQTIAVTSDPRSRSSTRWSASTASSPPACAARAERRTLPLRQVEQRAQSRDDAVPVAECRLAQELRCRIPGAVRAPAQPAEIRRERQQEQEPLAERAGEMRDRGVDRDDRVEPRDQRRRVGKVLGHAAEIEDTGVLTQDRCVAVAQIALQADELRAAAAQQRRQPDERQRAVPVVVMRAAPRPGDADQRPVRRQPLCPDLRPCGGDLDVRRSRRDRRGCRA